MNLVFVRHGQSIWNLENKFTGWVDVGLSPNGNQEASDAGKTLIQEKFLPDICFTSFLKRSIDTAEILLNNYDHNLKDNIQLIKDWRLNERHYGSLQGLNKSETAEKYGEDQVLIWRRSYDIKPPELDRDDDRHPRFDKKYADLSSEILPSSECLKDTVERFLPYWEKTISPQINSGKCIMIVAHGNSLRALVKHLDRVSDKDIIGINIPTGVPLIYELDRDLIPIKNYYLGDQEKILEKIKSVEKQGESKK